MVMGREVDAVMDGAVALTLTYAPRGGEGAVRPGVQDSSPDCRQDPVGTRPSRGRGSGHCPGPWPLLVFVALRPGARLAGDFGERDHQGDGLLRGALPC